MSNSLSSIDHCISHPAASGLFIAFHSGVIGEQHYCVSLEVRSKLPCSGYKSEC
jgi:hypothetical protein